MQLPIFNSADNKTSCCSALAVPTLQRAIAGVSWPLVKCVGVELSSHVRSQYALLLILARRTGKAEIMECPGCAIPT